MTHKERAIAALTLKVPDRVPTFELGFQLEEEMFGRKFLPEELELKNLRKLSSKEKEIKLGMLAEYAVEVFDKLEYSILPVNTFGRLIDWGRYHAGTMNEEFFMLLKILRETAGDDILMGFHGDGTFAIPDGDKMLEFVYEIADNPDGVKEKAQRMARAAIERNKAVQECGVDCLLLCSDYCYNSGPFISPEMFREFIQPYLYEIIKEARKDGLYTIKHTDGNIMPILDQLVECNPHALHSIDPMAGVDIREVKRLVGNKVALCGNVHCAALQTGTDEEVLESAEYCMKYGKPGGGYFFCTSNLPFKGMKAERYEMILDVWKKHRDY